MSTKIEFEKTSQKARMINDQTVELVAYCDDCDNELPVRSVILRSQSMIEIKVGPCEDCIFEAEQAIKEKYK